MREERRGESFQDISFLSTEFCRSEFIEKRVKVHLLDKGYVWVPKKGISLKIQLRRFQEIKIFKIRRCS